ncbi:MAG TPA: TIGR03560 family F420-dependent LLM class oxidoreductase [Candidatus Binatia bacterium]|nr:TIGR03560 family F420-dependent LLM class oxidoreductase [Candidatus Binatia bacterium]
MRFGIHAGPQDCSIDELRRLWRIADERGFHWCSVWDHLFSVSDLNDPVKPAFEGVAAMAALASETRRVRVGCLVFCVAYRAAGVLAKAATTIDHLSGGRCELGIGSGWNEIEARAFGVPFGTVRERLDLLEETAIVLRRLFDGERVTFEGRHVRLDGALCEPRPVQPRLRLWIGGQGERRLLRIVARHADGWNVPFLAPEIFAQRNATLDRWCEKEGRDPRSIVRTVNLGLAVGADAADVRRQEENLRLMFGPMTDFVRPGILVGTPAEVVERIRQYRAAGAEWVNLALRAPFDWNGLELFIHEVMPRVDAAG